LATSKSSSLRRFEPLSQLGTGNYIGIYADADAGLAG
jgi:hypothetical protein